MIITNLILTIGLAVFIYVLYVGVIKIKSLISTLIDIFTDDVGEVKNFSNIGKIGDRDRHEFGADDNYLVVHVINPKGEKEILTMTESEYAEMLERTKINLPELISDNLA